jgi:alcohol dehydrogenase
MTMHGLVFDGPGASEWREVPLPVPQDDRDAIVRVDATTICGTDLHILKGDVPEVSAGRILGHEAVSTVVEAGPMTGRTVGDRVLVSCISGCGRCRFCREGRYGQCQGGGGWVLGHLIDGTQAEFVRVPFADTSLFALPDGVSDEAALMLSDITPTAYEVGVRNGMVRPGDTVVVVGSGPIGLAAIMTAQLFSPSHIVAVDTAASRLEAAKALGADVVVDARLGTEELTRVVAEVTDGLGADVVMEAVGTPATFETCTELVRPGGRVANIGVHGAPATLHLETLWSRDVTITTGLVDTSSTPGLLGMVASGQLDVSRLVTHRFQLHEMAEAYRVFSEAAETHALKVMLTRD